MSRRPTLSERREAFSLVELMLVVTVLGILAAMVAPELGGSRQEALLRAAARQLVSTFRLARSQAVTARQTVTFAWHGSEQRYRLQARRDELAGLEQPGDTGPELQVPGAEGEIDRRVTVRLLTAAP